MKQPTDKGHMSNLFHKNKAMNEFRRRLKQWRKDRPKRQAKLAKILNR